MGACVVIYNGMILFLLIAFYNHYSFSSQDVFIRGRVAAINKSKYSGVNYAN
jgi:hypothetical protein